MSLAGAGRSPHNHCRQAISADRRTHPPIKQNVSFALFIAARQSPPTGAPEPLKAKRQFCANTGQGTMSLAGAGRSPHNYCRQAISADRRTHPPQSKTSVLRFLLPTGTPPSGAPPKKPPCLRPQRRQRTPAPSEAPPKAAPALPVCSQPGSNQAPNQVPQPAKTKSEDGLKDHRERG